MSILKAIERELNENKNVPETADVGYICLGYRGWLDAVRNTAELHQCVLLNVDSELWGVGRDTRAVIRNLARQSNDPVLRDNSVLVSEIVPDIFTACGNAIRLWLNAKPSIPIKRVKYNFEPITLPAAEYPDKALARLGFVEPTQLAEGIAIKPRKKCGKRGRKLAPDTAEKDLGIYEGWRRGWESGKYRIIAEYAKDIEWDMEDLEDLELLIDRVRKRVDRKKQH